MFPIDLLLNSKLVNWLQFFLNSWIFQRQYLKRTYRFIERRIVVVDVHYRDSDGAGIAQLGATIVSNHHCDVSFFFS